jgi:hypothetical protein
MIKSKVLTDSAWKDVLAKNKGIKDNGLLKALGDIKKLGDDDHDGALKILDQVQKLVVQLKKSKEVAAAPAVGKCLTELAGAADTAVRDVAKAKAEADKAAKAKAEADKKAHAAAAKKGDKDEDDEDEEEASPELLTTKLKPLLRMVAKGETMHALLAKSGKRVVVMLSRKPIPPARRKMLAEQLGGGSTKYFPGHCSLEAGATTFVLKAEVAGMSKLVKAALLEQTGLRVNKIKCRGEDGDDDDGDDDEGGAAAAEGAPEQAAAPKVAAAPAQPKPEAKAAAAPPAQASDEAGAPEAPATPQQMEVLQDRRRQFKSARAAWVTVKARAEADLEKVKDGVRMAYMADPEQFPKIVAGCKEIDAILDNLDDELRDTLDQYASTPLRNQKKLHALADTAKQTLDRYQGFVANNGVMKAIDEKEFADVTVHAPVLKALADLRKAMV